MVTVPSKEELIKLVLKRLKARYHAQMRTSLDHGDPWQLLVATILSAQSQDMQVNKVTGKLFKEFKSVASFAEAKPKELYPYIKTLGLYRSKAKHVVEAAKVLASRFDSSVPHTIEELTEMPGVGRKTANVVLSNAFGINEGIAIDTHCTTVSNRLGIVNSRDPRKIESAVMKITPTAEWGNISLLFIALGRDVCTARVKYCARCVLNDICPSSDAGRKGLVK